MKIARATHNVWAYRVGNASDNDDDGETAAGGRMAELLAVCGVDGWLCVVTRHYGGIKLGPDRFRHFKNAARELLERVGAIAPRRSKKKSGKEEGGRVDKDEEEEEEEKKTKTKKKKKKKSKSRRRRIPRTPLI